MGGITSGRRNASSTPGLPAPHRRQCQDEAATRFQWSRPEPGCSGNAPPHDAGAINHRGRRIQGELKNLLEDAAVRRAESSASRRQGYPSEHRAATSRFMREASVHTGRTRNTAPAAPGRLDNEHHHRNRRAPRREGAARLPPQAWGTLRQRGGSESLARTTWPAGFQPRHTTGAVPDPVLTPDYYHKVLGGDETGTVARGLPAGLPTGWNGR
jgi:hypothetical protein